MDEVGVAAIGYTFQERAGPLNVNLVPADLGHLEADLQALDLAAKDVKSPVLAHFIALLKE